MQTEQNQKLPRREREKQRQRQEILDTALALFAEKGYHNVSMHEIAAKAEFATGTLYKFFQNKEDLYKTLVLEQCDLFDHAFARVIDAPRDEVEKLRDYVRVKAAMFREHMPFIRLFLAESRGASFNINAGLDASVRKRYYDFLKRLSSVFESGIAHQRFKTTADPFYLAVAVDSVINSFLLMWIDDPQAYPFPEDPDQILKLFFDGMPAPP
ncbi:MAG: TetR/AcrR family transcriptional regulator [Desulfobacterales bacterium]|nr:TetR/AcrR family transcriptional regulator [Desulfobacterales bacterium]